MSLTPIPLRPRATTVGRVLLAMLVFTLVLLCAAGHTAEAHARAKLGGGHLLGHRCRTYSPDKTKEDTVRALVDTSAVRGAWCEVDAWRLDDNKVIIWHDATWRRVADPKTLPKGIKPDDRVEDAIWRQVKKIRTRGGARVAGLGRMIGASANHHVPLVVEVRNTIPSPASYVTRARTVGADVRYYQVASAACDTGQIDQLRSAGAIVGVKTGAHAACPMTPQKAHTKGLSFIVDGPSRITTAYTDSYRAQGVDVYVRGAHSDTAHDLLDQGAAKLIVNRPRNACQW